MDFELSEEQAALRAVSRSLLAACCPSQLVRALAESGRDTDETLWRRGAELGWIGLAVPEEHGGAGQGLAELCLVAEELGRAAAPGAFPDSALTALAVAGRGRADLAGALAAGELKASWAHHGRVTCAPGGDGVTLSGRATAVQAAAAADWLLVTAAGRPGRCLALVPRDRVRVEPRRTLDETRRWYDVIFDSVHVPPSGVVTAGEEDIRWLADAGAVLTAADSLGAGERLLEMTAGHVKVREQFGRPLGSFQAVKHKLSDMLATLKGARAATYYAAMSLDFPGGGTGAAAAVSAAKAFTGERVAALAGEALQLHGGTGFTWEHDLHLYLRRVKVNEMLYGTAAEHCERLVSLLE